MKLAAAIAILIQLLFVVSDYLTPPSTPGWAYRVHLVTFGVGGAAIAVAGRPVFERHWRGIALALALALVVNLTATGAIPPTPLPAILSLVMVSFGAAILIPWETRYQLVLNLACVAATLIGVDWAWPASSALAVRYGAMSLLTAAIITQFGVFHLISWRRAAHAAWARRAGREDDLARRDAEISLLTDNLIDIVLALDAAGKIVEVTGSAERTLGYARDELIGRSALDLVHEQDRDAVAAAFARAVKAPGDPGRVNCRLRHKTSGWRAIAAIGQAVRAPVEPVGDAGHVTIIASLRDVTENIQQEQAQAVWSAFAGASDNALTVTTPEGVYVSINPAAERIFGYRAEEVIGRHFSEFVPRELRRELRDVIARLERGERIEDFETRRARKDGSLLDVSQTISPIRSASGELLGYATVTRNITEHKRTERALRESEAKFRKIFDESADAIAINALEDGKYLDVNYGNELITGYSREAALGRTPRELGIWSNPDDLREAMRELRVEGFVRNREARLIRRDGTRIMVLFSAVIVEFEGRRCLLSFSRDITRLKRFEEELLAARGELARQVEALEASQESLRAEIAERRAAQQSAEERAETLRKIFETSTDTITINRMADGRYVDLNQQFIKATGLEKRRTLEKSPSELGVWADKAQLREFLAKLQAGEHVRNMEADFVTRRGRRPCLISAQVVTLNGEPCVISIVRDITRLKKAEATLVEARDAAEAASRAKSEFLSSMSHEIRTPMNAILGMAEVLDEMPLGAEMRLCVQTMKRNGHALLALISDILDLAKIESGKLELERTPFDLEALVESAAETMALRAHEKGLELVASVAAEAPRRLIGDPLRIRQILVNFLSNAIKFTAAGEVVLKVGREHGAPDRATFEFSVSDTGVGIPADQFDVIFASFTQADSSITRRYGGSGLGLAIVRRLAESMNGRVWVESELGRGSVFHFSVDLEIDAEEPGLATVAPPAGLRVMIVDDSAANRTLLREMLAGCAVDEAASGEEAARDLVHAEATGSAYDLVLLDWRLHRSNPFALAERIARRNDAPARNIAMLTSHELARQIEQARADGLRYLVKPVKRADLYATIATAPDPPSADAPRSSPPPIALGPPGQRLSILLAEDSPDNRLLVELYLKNAACDLDYAENGRFAVEKFAGGRYALVLMDIQMPVMDGISAAREIRRWEHEHGQEPTPIIALTASALSEDVSKSLEAGCNLHLSKPISKAALHEAIRTVLADRGANGRAEIVVTVDPDIGDLIPGFLARKRADAGNLIAALERGDHEAVRRVGHKLKGEGASFGFVPVTEFGAALERSAAARDLSGARQAALALKDYLERVRVVSPADTAQP